MASSVGSVPVLDITYRQELASASDWLLRHASRHLTADALLDGLNRNLLEQGVPVWRSSLNVHTMHPEVSFRNIVWSREEGSRSTLISHIDKQSETYRNSPVSLIYEGSDPIRVSLRQRPEELYFPICRELAEEGGTDYFIMPIVFGDGQRTFASFATDHPNGFSDEHLQNFIQLAPLLAVRLELESTHFAKSSLLQLYLGKNAAHRVLQGAFIRGQGQPMQAAIWYCDLRNFTLFSDQAAPDEVVATLDKYFEGVADPIHAGGGEVLKFIGDAVLAVFDFATLDPWQACRNAMASAQQAIRATSLLSLGELPAKLGVSLHVGSVMYGNIGSRDRLDFTVIGSAVNEVCRMETLCKTLGVPLVMSEKFNEMCGYEEPVCLGQHELKGVREPQTVYTIEEIESLTPVLGNTLVNGSG